MNQYDPTLDRQNGLTSVQHDDEEDYLRVDDGTDAVLGKRKAITQPPEVDESGMDTDIDKYGSSEEETPVVSNPDEQESATEDDENEKEKENPDVDYDEAAWIADHKQPVKTDEDAKEKEHETLDPWYEQC